MAKFKFTWAHGLMIALGSFMIFILSLIFFAGNMGEMVEENYYEKTVHYQDEIDAAQRVKTLDKKPEIIEQANGFLIRFYDQPESGEIWFLRSNNSDEDVKQSLKLNTRKEQLVHALDLKNGEYEVSIRWKQNGQNYLLKQTVNWKAPSS
ncbi:FixH family protein [Moheibacter lacus]|uniref:FixH family protein n=1 Tax=Moheibacter lacus TaxID=2745851 RepID=A0A838ZM63_9FLAO|nr:FixH family protein [Moheibacter lacus]MBA5628666.1 FixH family protein [Moheibacter lacus]